MNGRLYDPLLRRFLNADENIQDMFNTQNYNKYGYVLNNPLMYNDLNGEWFGIDDLIVAGVSFVIGYVSHGIKTGEWSWNAVKAGFQMAVMGWIAYNTCGIATAGQGIISGTAGTAMWNFIANSAINTAISCVIPPINIEIGDFDFSISPSIAIGKGWGFGANVSATFHVGDFSISAGYGIMHYGGYAGTGEAGWQYRKSAMVNYQSKSFSIGLGTNSWTGMYSQQTGIISIGSGDFSLSYENDGSPFDKKAVAGGILGDGNDRWRTAAMTINIGDFHAGFNLFTGVRKSESYDNGWDNQMMDYVKKNGSLKGLGGATYPYGFAYETGKQYRLGAAYIGWGDYRIGINSDRYVRHPIQNILAHGKLSPQPGFIVLSTSINPYFQYQTRNKFTSW